MIFSIDAGDKISEVDGPSAGALMTLLAISAIEKHPINGSLAMTGTINSDGHIGSIGKVVAKATAAKDQGKTLFLLPAENQLITPPASGTAAKRFLAPLLMGWGRFHIRQHFDSSHFCSLANFHG